MNLQPPAPESASNIGQICAREVARNGWKLTDEPILLADGRTFAQRVAERVASLCAAENRPVDATMVVRAVRTEYGCLSHHAVSLNGHRVQSIALEETFAEGWKVASKRCSSEDAENALSDALLKLWQHIGTIRPESYYPWFYVTLRREIQQIWRRRKGGGGGDVSFGELHSGSKGDDNPEEWDEHLADPGATGERAYEAVLADVALSSLVDVVRKCLKNPRSTYVVISNFVLELNPSEIAAQLKVTVAAIYMIKHQARRRIRENCAESLLQDLRSQLQTA